MKIRSLLIAATALSALASAAQGQPSASADVDARAKFIAPLSITGVTPLNFGTFIRPTAAGSVVISPAGHRSGDPTAITDAANTPTAAAFSVTSEGGQAVSLSFTQLSGLANHDLDAFTVTGEGPCSGASATALNMTGTGTQACTISVGATLSYPANPAGGDLGQLQATVAYN